MWPRFNTLAATLLAITIARAAAAWPTDSHLDLPLCGGSIPQIGPAIVADGSGGALVAWSQATGDGHIGIYAQHVLAGGAFDPAWPSGCRALTLGTSREVVAAIVGDGAGGAIVTWHGSDSDVFAQHVLAGGALDSRWPENGSPVCTAVGSQSYATPITDGAGGAFVVWQDRRVVSRDDLFAQHVTADGHVDPRWPTDGMYLAPSSSGYANMPIVSDGSGGFLLVWGGSSVLVRHVRADGTPDPAWPASDVPVSAALDSLCCLGIESDGAGGALVRWADMHVAARSIMTEHVRADGTVDPAWPAGGLAAAFGTDAPVIASAPDGQGGLVVAWCGNGGSFAQHVLFNGAVDPAWPLPGRNLGVVTASDLKVVADGSGGIVVAWSQSRDIYAQRVLANGLIAAGWPAGGRPVCRALDDQNTPVLAGDGAGGAILAWNDNRDPNDPRVFLQRVQGNGQLGPADPMPPIVNIPVCMAVASRYDEQEISDGAGGAIVAWSDQRDPSTSLIYAQHVLTTGIVDPSWPVNGRAVDGAALHAQRDPAMIPDGAGGFIITWAQSSPDQTGSDIYAQHVLANGTPDPNWPSAGVPVCTATNTQQNPKIATDGAGGAIVAWQDQRAGHSSQAYVQHVLSSGNVDPAWLTDGLLLSTTYSALISNNPYDDLLVVAADAAGGAFIVWQGYNGIFAMHVRSDGTTDPAWSADASLPHMGSYGYVFVLPDRAGGLLIGNQYGGLVVAQDLSSRGIPQWSSSDVAVNAAAMTASTMAMASDGAGGLLFSWIDGRDRTQAVYAQRVAAGGRVAWQFSGTPVEPSDNVQLASTVASDGAGGAIVGWSESRNAVTTGWDVYAAHVLTDGTVDPTWRSFQPLTASPGDQGVQPPSLLMADGNGGAIAIWHDGDHLLGERVLASGRLLPDPAVPVGPSFVPSDVSASDVRLTWLVTEPGVSAAIYRNAGGVWTRIGSAISDPQGWVRYHDRAVQPGARYGYRIGLGSAGLEQLFGETWVLVPYSAVLAIDGMEPNPAVGDLNLSFSLASATAARIELIDVSGRPVATRMVAHPRSGKLVERFGESGRMEPGIYLVRLTQDQHSVTKKVCLLR